MSAAMLLKLVQIKCIFLTSDYIIFLFDIILSLFDPFFFILDWSKIVKGISYVWRLQCFEKNQKEIQKIFVMVTCFWLASTIKVNYRGELHARSKAEAICFQPVIF